MLPLEFFGQNLHFALNLFMALVMFAIFWLYFDAWLGTKRKKEILKWFAFLLLCITFLLQALTLESQILGPSLLGGAVDQASVIIRLVGYAVLVVALLGEPLQERPQSEGLKLPSSPAMLPLTASGISKVFLPLGAVAVAFLYFRKATDGLEKHLRAVAIGFLLLAASEGFGIAATFRDTNNVTVEDLTRAFGPLWALEQLFLLGAILVLGRWVWGYLVKRVQSQLFILFTAFILVIFLLVSVSFTYVLVRNIQNDALENLKVSAKVLDYSLSSKQAEITSIAEVYAQNSDVKAAVLAKDHNKLASLLGNSLETKQISSIVVTNNNALVLARAEEPDSWGDSLSSDPLIQKAIAGQSETSVVSQDGVVAPTVYLQAAAPIKQGESVIGVVQVSLAIGNNLLDGIKNSTGLDSAVYAGNVRAATTLLSPDQKSRHIGIKEENSQVKNQVLEKGETFSGQTSNFNRPFLAVYSPLKDSNKEVVGMLFTGQSSVSVLLTAGQSIELVFIMALVLMMLALIPAYLISKYITYQVR